VETVAEAHVIRMGGRVGVARIQVWQERSAGNESTEAREGEQAERRLVAEATGAYSVRRLQG
jgi:acyl-coenzyme A thioesterase PaaI-like protein